MSSKNHSPESSRSLEDNAREVFRRAQRNLSEQLHHCEDSVRQSPANSVVVAGLVGYFLHVLPIGALLGGIVRLLAALVRPTIFLYVAAKLIDGMRSSANAEIK